MIELRGILFDKDGTLFDFSKTWEAWASSFLFRIADDAQHAKSLGAAIGFDLEHQRFEQDSIVIAGTPAEVAQVLTSRMDGRSFREILNLINEEAETAPQTEATPLVPFVNGLKGKGYYVGVVTNDAERPARAHLQAAGVEPLFDFVAGFDSGFGAKPAPGQLLAFAEAVEIEPASVLMVGDSTHDLIAAQRAGMRAVGVLTGLADVDDLAPFAEAVLPDIAHLPQWIAAQKSS